MSIQNNCISRFFNVDENKLLVGNGAAELINNLRYIIKGKVGVPVPTFNEYVRCLPNCEMCEIDLSKNYYKMTKELLLSYIDRVDNLVIVNPDNPCGSFLTFEDALEIVEKYNAKDKYVIFDESFIDFADEDKRYSLITDEILNKYKKLIVIKSISKSYGVPGLRLGVLANADEQMLKNIKNNMPVWNINSFAEYFLQIFIPFKNFYLESCNKIEIARNNFIKELKKIDFLEVYESQANYLMLKLKKIKAHDLCLFLLKKHNILIKDLSSKNGFNNEEFIRVAIRDENDNMTLVNALKMYNK